MSTDEYAAFMRIVTQVLGTKATGREPDSDGLLQVADGEEDMRTIALGNLARLCHQVPLSEWPLAVRDHFAALNAPTEAPSSFAEAAHLLRVRLVPRDYVYRPAAVTQQVAEGVDSALVVDFDLSLLFATEANVEQWGVNENDLFDLALNNVRHNDPVEVNLQDGMTFLLGRHPYVATHLLCLEDYLDVPAPHGAIVAVPTRDWVAFQPIRDLSIIRSINSIIPFIHGLFDDGPYSLTPDLFWWRDGSLTVLPSRIDGQTLAFAPPDDFVAVLNQLPSA
jgi:hypothetical protein